MPTPAVMASHNARDRLQAQRQQQSVAAGYQARPSRRIKEPTLQADGDSWQETLAVCESPPPNSKLMIRSFYQNNRTGKRVWDEPPSGASHVIPASDEMRRMAQAQLQEMQVVVMPTESDSSAAADSTPKNNKTSKRSFFGFGKKKKDKKAKEHSQERIIQYKKDSMLRTRSSRQSAAAAGGRPSGGAVAENDIDMQEAIARSIAESQGIPYAPGSQTVQAPSAASHPTGFQQNEDDDEELAMAKALSLSEAESKAAPSPGFNMQPSIPAAASPAIPTSEIGNLIGDLSLNVPPTAAASSASRSPPRRLKIPEKASSQRKAPPSYSVTPAQSQAPPPSAVFDPYHQDNDDSKPSPMERPTAYEASSASASFPSPSSVSKKKRLQLPNLGRSSRSSKVQEQAGLV